MLDLWYKNAVVYCLDVETFMDSNGDGVGDFRGLTDRLDYLEGLGVTCLWLNPFYPTPNRDNGYDITDFYGVDPRLGTLGDFVEFSRAARERGMMILVDLVVNHTSIDHPWFEEARDPDSPRHDWYVWSDKKPDDLKKGIVFPGVQEAVWTYCKKARKWYMHRFYEFQPDLNIANPRVREEIMRIMGFWLEIGVSGFRVDAVPYLVEYKGLKEEPDRDPMLLLSEMRDFLSWRRAGTILLAETNVTHDKIPEYFGGHEFGTDERMHMCFDFPLNQAVALALVRGDAAPIREAILSRPVPPPLQAQWANFLRNHDELSLDKLTEEERQEVFDAWAPEDGMQIYGRGIRRRLAPMLGGDPARLALAHSLLFALPGTPVMWYGDEIGMGENLDLDERNSVRTPMAWNAGDMAGFSCTEGELVRPLASEGPYDHRSVNVAAQIDKEHSLMAELRRLIRARRAAPEIGWGACSVIEDLPDGVLGLRHDWRGNAVVTYHNLADCAVEVKPDVGDEDLKGLLRCDEDVPAGSGFTLRPHDWKWYRVGGERR
ncbi:alpha-amylase family protein [Wenxinia saemankumensis]|uniref:Maltose alpha-D-glucosyltransferase/ alpha-amylase n=1 Tax=Wenxinia saemankumensis TaxID=1447782 RepID=A0A1M6AJ20_9RHOB|nr:alpha-amylase family protein [Wenxinia saemankumensis]SHI36328.1 maltose alpha-D-glucosyltransferase/ alpha-amylase [Wenxinia saemankumensis]